MRTDNIKVKLDISIPTDRPDKNGTIYTTDAVLKAFTKEKLDKLPYVDNRAYHICIDGLIRYGGTECYINKMHKDENGVTVVDDFTIVGFGISL